MRFIHVATPKIKNDAIGIDRIIARQTGHCLCSLIGGLRQVDFGLHTLTDVIMRIRAYKETSLDPFGAKSFTDSGGYSIIVGDVWPSAIRRFIKCYNVYLEDERDDYSYIFSLDIPFSLKFPSLNKAHVLYELNREALMDALAILEKYPELKDKYYFVWHFKMLSQYALWCRLYDELNLGSVIRNRAIGGMVGMRAVTKKHFSPFTGIAYRCLLDYLDQGDFGHPFRLHFLGMYIPYDRFQIALLEAMFRSYLSGMAEVELSYDSINYAHTARMNARKEVHNLEDGHFVSYPAITDVPEFLLHSVYGTAGHLDPVLEEIERRRNDTRLENADTFAPLSIHSNLCLDRLFEMVIAQYDLVDIIATSQTHTVLDGRTRSVLRALKARHPNVFTDYMCRCILENISIAYEFHY